MASSEPLTPYDRVQALRVARGLSERKACEQAGVAANLLAQARASKSLSLDSLQKFASAFAVTLGKLTGEATAGEAPAAGRDPEARLAFWSQLCRSSFNPRRSFPEDSIAELAESIAGAGLLQNLVVREIDSPHVVIRDANGVRQPLYEIVAGERRYRALSLLVQQDRWNPSAPLIPVRVLAKDDGEALAIALLENLQREDVAPIDEAEALARLHELDKVTWSTEAIAARIGKTVRHVQGRIALVRKLTDETKEALRDGKISVTQARAIALAAPKQQAKLVAEAASNSSWMTESRIREQLTRNLPWVEFALFDLADYTGEFIEPEQEGQPRRFADRKAFDKLQKPFVDAKVEKLKKKWAFVDQRKGTPTYWDYDEAPKGAKDAGAALYVEASGKIHTKTGLHRKGSAPGQSAADRQRQQEADARKRKQRTESLVAFREAARPQLLDKPRLARVLLVAGALDSGWVEEALRDPELEPWRALDGVPLLDALDTLDGHELDAIAFRAIAEHVDVGSTYDGVMNAEAYWLAGKLELPMPKGWKPPRGLKPARKGGAATEPPEDDSEEAPFDQEPENERACRACGCTDDFACEGGCSWVEEDLCSACAEKGETAPAEDREAA